MPPDAPSISRSEREELRRIVNERARLAKARIEQRQAELLADAEEQLAAEYHFDHEAWKEVTATAAKQVQHADDFIAEKCRELGIREEFRPQITINWYRRGENASMERRAELRKVAQTRIAAAGKQAKNSIEAAALERREALALGALESAEAKAFIESMPSVEALMPAFDIAELEGVGDGDAA